MTESEWLESADPARMLNWLRAKYVDVFRECPVEVSDRKLWMFICAVERVWWEPVANVSSRDTASIVTLERMADTGSVSRRGLDHAHFTYTVPANAHDAALECVRIHNSKGDHQRWAGILRDIVGNPFRPTTLPTSDIIHEEICPLCDGMGVRNEIGPNTFLVTCWKCNGCKILATPHPGPCPWLTPTVLSLVDAVYHERQADGALDPLRLSVLADALEESGCDNADILDHLRSPGPHWRGYWVVDLLLGKE